MQGGRSTSISTDRDLDTEKANSAFQHEFSMHAESLPGIFQNSLFLIEESSFSVEESSFSIEES